MRDALPEDRCPTPLIRVLGLGSPFGDDRVGWRVVELLDGRLPATIELQTLDRPGAGLVAAIQDTDHLVVIDAASQGATPGRIMALDPDDLAGGGTRLSSHGLDLQQALALADALGRLPARVDIFAIELGTLDAARLGDPVEAAARKLADRLVAEFDRC